MWWPTKEACDYVFAVERQVSDEVAPDMVASIKKERAHEDDKPTVPTAFGQSFKKYWDCSKFEEEEEEDEDWLEGDPM